MRSYRSFAILLFALPLFACASTAPVGETPPVAPTSPVVQDHAETHAEHLLRLVGEAKKACADVTLPDKVTVDNGTIIERPVILCAYKESDRSWHAIEVRLPQPIPVDYKHCVREATVLSERASCMLPLRVMTQGYDVEHVGYGYGIGRFAANVYETHEAKGPDGKNVTVRGERLLVYRTRHLWFDDAALLSGDAKRITETATPAEYTPYDPAFYDPGLIAKGEELLYGEVSEAKLDLRNREVPSLAFPGKTVADVIPWEIPYVLALIEHTDDLEFKEDPHAVDAQFIEIALNGVHAFEWSYSTAKAVGLMQFTDAGGNGTYTMVRNLYPDASLDPDFVKGSRDHVNAIKAAICLIDFELSQFTAVKPVFKKEPLLGGIYPVAAYNGGHARAKELYDLMKAGKIKLDNADQVPQRININERHGHGRHRTVKRITISLNGETYGYITKYIRLVNELIPTLDFGDCCRHPH